MRGDSRSNPTTDHAMTHVGTEALGILIVVVDADLPPEAPVLPIRGRRETSDLEVDGAGSLSLMDAEAPGMGGADGSQDGKVEAACTEAWTRTKSNKGALCWQRRKIQNLRIWFLSISLF